MPNQAPMWWMRGGQQTAVPHPNPPAAMPQPNPPLPPPAHEPPMLPPPPREAPHTALPVSVSALTDRLRRMDGETLLLLALLWLLRQEHADPKLLLALAYIAL